MVSFNKSKYGDYSILNCQDIMAWFLDKRKENQSYYGCCEKRKCFLCQRFDCIKKQLQKKYLFWNSGLAASADFVADLW